MTEQIPQSEAKTAKAGEVELVYDTFGDPEAPPLLLIMGLGAQMITWDEPLCAAFARRGFYVIRFDNRDVGLSTKFDEAGMPNVLALFQGEQVDVPYNLEALAADTAGLLDALGIDSAHVMGASMGGMIAQLLAIHYPERVRTLTCLGSSSQAPDLPPPGPEAMQLLLAPPPTGRESAVEQGVRTTRLLNGNLPFDETRAREQAGAAWDRGIHPAGTARQMAAILSSSWHRQLPEVTVPTLVIHGEADPLLPLPHGVNIAEKVPGASLLVIDDAGHVFPPATWPTIVDAVAEHALAHLL